MSIGKTIARLRKARQLSQPELARRVGISQPSLSNIENDKTETLRGETLAGLCRELGVLPDTILRSAPDANPAAVAQEAELTAIWRVLTTEDRSHLLAAARAFRERMRPGRLTLAAAAPARSAELAGAEARIEALIEANQREVIASRKKGKTRARDEN